MIIPRKSVHRFVFVSNIKDPLAGQINPSPGLMEAFLLSETYSTPSTLLLAKNAKANGSLMISDNGNFSRMKSMAAKFQAEGNKLLAVALKETRQKGAPGRNTLHQRNRLFREITGHVQKNQGILDMTRLIGRQLQCNPDYLIGLEDFVIPVLHLCNVLHPVYNAAPSEIRMFQKNTQKMYARQLKGDYGYKKELEDKAVFLVYHACNYATAKQAAALNRKTVADGIAISFGATLASRSFVDFIKIDRKTYRFDESLPESYLLSVALVLGAHKGDTRKLPVHILGLGTPILIVLVAALLCDSVAISIDSTATFKDADDGNVYGSRDAFLKMDMYKLAAYALVNDDPYQSASPWFMWFESQFPSNWKGLKARLDVQREDAVSSLAEKLKAQPALLEEFIPFFSPMRKGNDEFIRKVRLARAGCNFWVLKKICAEVRKRKNNKTVLFNWVEREVVRYERSASPKWASAVWACFRIIKETNGV